jgi:hypothetical protein
MKGLTLQPRAHQTHERIDDYMKVLSRSPATAFGPAHLDLAAITNNIWATR